MPARSRTRDQRATVTGGLYHFLSVPKLQFYSVLDGRREACDDFVGNRTGANGFDMRTNEVNFPLFSGEFYSGSMLHTGAYGLPAANMNPEAPDPLTRYGTVSSLGKSNAAWDILANTNPNVPDVSLPTFLGELKDFPSLLRQFKELPQRIRGHGRDLLKEVAQGHLSWRWAIKPMMGDIRKMLDFQKAVNDRVQWLKHLRDGNGLKRRCSLASDENTGAWSGSSPIHTNGFTVQARSRVLHSMRMWGTVQYKVAPGTVLPETDSEINYLAWRLTYGITSHEALATAWELLPWSWAVDWFIGVGNTIAALNNTVPLTWGRFCLMRTIKALREFEITTKPAFISVSGVARGERIRKERYVIAPILPFSLSLPLVDSGKWSVLASLAALRRK